jgi:hypothetical protein
MDCAGYGISVGDVYSGVGDSEMEVAYCGDARGDRDRPAHERYFGEGPERDGAMTVLACAALLIGIFVYVFYPQSKTEEQTQKTRLEFLRERKETIYENLRDLNFEYRAGKYPEEDYLAQRAGMENEAAQILAEIEFLETTVHAA